MTDPARAPRQPDEGSAPPAILRIEPQHAAALDGLHEGTRVLVITWLRLADRDTLVVHPRGDRRRRRTGVFATRAPVARIPSACTRPPSPPCTPITSSSITSRPSTEPRSSTSNRCSDLRPTADDPRSQQLWIGHACQDTFPSPCSRDSLRTFRRCRQVSRRDGRLQTGEETLKMASLTAFTSTNPDHQGFGDLDDEGPDSAHPPSLRRRPVRRPWVRRRRSTRTPAAAASLTRRGGS